jgi:hypothetical protein
MGHLKWFGKRNHHLAKHQMWLVVVEFIQEQHSFANALCKRCVAAILAVHVTKQSVLPSP